MNYKPDFNRLKKVLLRDGLPDILPHFEISIDMEIMQAVLGKPIGYKEIAEFYYKMGYDYAKIGMNPMYKFSWVATTDTATFSRGKRHFVNDSQGIIENRKDFDNYQWPDIDKSIAGPVNEINKYLYEGMKTIILTPGGVLENVMWLMGYVPLSFALYEDEQLVWDMFERIGSDLIKAIQLCLENTDINKIGAIILGDDMGFNHSTMLSPEMLRKFVFPWQKKIVDLAHSYMLPVILHSCGNLESIMDDIIDYVGIDAKHSYEDKIMPVTEAKRRYGKRVAILGGIDMHFLCTSEEDELRSYVDNVIDICAEGGGYALGTGNTVSNYVPLRNYYAMLDEGRKKGVYII